MTVRSLRALFMPNMRRRSMATPRAGGGHIIQGNPRTFPVEEPPPGGSGMGITAADHVSIEERQRRDRKRYGRKKR